MATDQETEAANLPAIVRQTAEADTKRPNEYRAESIGKALDAAYARASTLQLTPDEAERLSADFPDEAFRLGAGGNASLIYIEHAYLRQRLNDVLGVGAAVPVRRREWSEKFQYEKDGAWLDAAVVYVDLVLLVRGCVVGEAIGEAVFYFSNKDGCYSDALESAKSNALRRCCKEFGVGLQAWMKGWSEEWKRRNPSGKARTNGAPAKTTPPPTKETAKFELPADWPDTQIHDIKLWIDAFSNVAQFEAAMETFLNEHSIVNTPKDWEPILLHLAAAYKAKIRTKVPGVDEMNKVIKAALDKMEADKAEAAALDQEAAQVAT